MSPEHGLACAILRRLLDSGVACTLHLSGGDFSVEIIGDALDVTGRQAQLDGALASATRDELMAGGMTAGDGLDALALELASGLSTTETIED